VRFSVSVYTLDREIFDARTFGLRLFLSFFSRRTVLIPTGNLAGGRARRVGAAPTEAIAWPGFAAEMFREKEEFYKKTPSRKKKPPPTRKSDLPLRLRRWPARFNDGRELPAIR